MTIVSLVIGGVALAAMIVIAAYGWITLPRDARVPIHHGLGSYGNFVSKTTGLIAWPAAGALLYALFGAISVLEIKPGHPGPTAPRIILPVVLVLVAAFEWGAIAAARRNNGLAE
jgi:hypothetical protein